MTKNKKASKIPEFANRETEAKFWDTHSVTEFLEEFTPVETRFSKNLSEGITIRFDKATLKKIRSIANKKGLGPTTLARMWILEHLTQQA